MKRINTIRNLYHLTANRMGNNREPFNSLPNEKENAQDIISRWFKSKNDTKSYQSISFRMNKKLSLSK